MKTKDVIINGFYFTNISGRKVLVRVTGKHAPGYNSTRARKPVDKFDVSRADNARAVQPRPASALHLTRDFERAEPGEGPRAMDANGKFGQWFPAPAGTEVKP